MSNIDLIYDNTHLSQLLLNSGVCTLILSRILRQCYPQRFIFITIDNARLTNNRLAILFLGTLYEKL